MLLSCLLVTMTRTATCSTYVACSRYYPLPAHTIRSAPGTILTTCYMTISMSISAHPGPTIDGSIEHIGGYSFCVPMVVYAPSIICSGVHTRTVSLPWDDACVRGACGPRTVGSKVCIREIMSKDSTSSNICRGHITVSLLPSEGVEDVRSTTNCAPRQSSGCGYDR
ncbi:hypothetical protein EX30DRAFT_188484 [Ascodesmis nigricans]|uniref:Secreted protein n=1 Tax=Ascodesmis nigricans TaxID=341454 RepID=A0A4S2N0U0_9PEZI|nr:hypothetical protein EX30DRAFT_188484 [Ascodesmis nigricans]